MATLTICYGALDSDGNIDHDYCYMREAKRYVETVPDDDGSDMVVERYALPYGREESEFTVTVLDQAEAEALAQRLIDRLADVLGKPCDWEIT